MKKPSKQAPTFTAHDAQTMFGVDLMTQRNWRRFEFVQSIEGTKGKYDTRSFCKVALMAQLQTRATVADAAAMAEQLAVHVAALVLDPANAKAPRHAIILADGKVKLFRELPEPYAWWPHKESGPILGLNLASIAERIVQQQERR